MSKHTRPTTVLIKLRSMPSSGTELYDSIMGKIEPELTSAPVKQMAVSYKGEDALQTKERAQRYYNAFVRFEKEMMTWRYQTRSQLTGFSHSALSYLEALSRAEENKALLALEKALLQMT